MKNEKIWVRYSEAVKLQIVQEIESTGCSISSVQKKYGIKGALTVQKWLKKYGKTHLLGIKIRVEMANEKSELDKLKAEIKELKEALVNTQLQNIKHKVLYEIACETLGESPEEFGKKKLKTEPKEPVTPKD